ncbi:MAG TPA: hypothetical protein VKR32_15900 [Puia sp.]|nr:hypothetical protein [Puia sp.]
MAVIAKPISFFKQMHTGNKYLDLHTIAQEIENPGQKQNLIEGRQSGSVRNNWFFIYIIERWPFACALYLNPSITI